MVFYWRDEAVIATYLQLNESLGAQSPSNPVRVSIRNIIHILQRFCLSNVLILATDKAET